MTPARIAAVIAFVRRRRLARIAIEPLLDDVMIKLFVPKQARESLPLNREVFLSYGSWRKRAVELFSFVRPL